MSLESFVDSGVSGNSAVTTKSFLRFSGTKSWYMSVALAGSMTPAQLEHNIMELEIVVLMVAVFGASALQSATGIGFGVIAGPILLILLNNGSAIQISIVLNLLIASLLTPALWKQSDKALLKNLVMGLVIGSPLGLLVFLSIDIVTLKISAGVAVLLTLILVLRDVRSKTRKTAPGPGRIEQVSIGAVAGIMGVCLAMPGPVPAAWMASKAFSKETIRATILAMFVVSYTVALVLQVGLAGIGSDVLRLSVLLAPATVCGILIGQFFSSRITEQVFRWILATVLVSTATVLFSTLG